MLSSRRWLDGGVLLLGGALIAAGCAKGGPGEQLFGFGLDGGIFGGVTEEGGSTADVGAPSTATEGTGLNSPPPGDDANGSSGDDSAAPGEGCDPNTCANGCCLNGVCKSGTDDTACGSAGGGACTDCTTSNQVCSFGSCVMNTNTSSSSGGTATGSSSGSTPMQPMRPMQPMPTASCGGKTCTNACFPLGLPCCTSAGACGCIALYFLPCN